MYIHMYLPIAPMTSAPAQAAQQSFHFFPANASGPSPPAVTMPFVQTMPTLPPRRASLPISFVPAQSSKPKPLPHNDWSAAKARPSSPQFCLQSAPRTPKTSPKSETEPGRHRMTAPGRLGLFRVDLAGRGSLWEKGRVGGWLHGTGS